MTDSQTSANHPKQPRRILALQRRRTALQMRLAGAGVEEIANTLGISNGRVSQLIGEARDELTAEIKLDANQYRNIQLHDIFTALSVIRSKLSSKDSGEQLAAIDRLNRLHERLAKLEGLDAPTKTDVTSDNKPLTFIIQRENGKDNTPSSGPA